MKPLTLPLRAFLFLCLLHALPSLCEAAQPDPNKIVQPLIVEPSPAWPRQNKEMRPWTYWWWPGSAVDALNLTSELERFAAAGYGGVHIIPIYGVKGAEPRYLEYLSDSWMRMFRHVVDEARRLGLGVDMTTGSGWCFGGPSVIAEDANAAVQVRTYRTEAGKPLSERIDMAELQSLMAFSSDGRRENLRDRLSPSGVLDWIAPQDGWTLYAISQKPSGQKVKRAGPGGQGHMLNLFHAPGVSRWLESYTKAFEGNTEHLPRAMYHDSYEYRSDWSPSLFKAFFSRRGYSLEEELHTLFSREPMDLDRTARVKCDYRETLAEIMTEDSLPRWTAWCRSRGILTRNQAHGSPGNLLDLYGLADVPETEMFHKDRDILVSKFASSAAHVLGKPLIAAETGTWLREHFTETLADLKRLQDDLFLSGVNHIVYHGACYSPDDAAWPGWLFYASTELNSRNPIWRDVAALNAYAARCQSWLQAGSHDSDMLLYWPIHDYWHDARGMVKKLTVHERDWLHGQSVGTTASALWTAGYSFDYVSDRQLAGARAEGGRVAVPGGTYPAVWVPKCRLMPHDTLAALLGLAKDGGTVVFEDGLPKDVPGLSQLEKRREILNTLLGPVRSALVPTNETPSAQIIVHGKGRLIVGTREAALRLANVPRETMVAHEGISYVRRADATSRIYFVVNRSTETYSDWLPLSWWGSAVAVYDPLLGRSGYGTIRRAANGGCEVRLELPPGHSVVLRVLVGPKPKVGNVSWMTGGFAGEAIPLPGPWKIHFGEGGPKALSERNIQQPQFWSAWNDVDSQSFAGTALYSTVFDAPNGKVGPWLLDLGEVAQSARIRLNGVAIATTFLPPHRLSLPSLRHKGNRLEIEVTSVAANRIRDLDRRGVSWRIFHDINFVNIDYKPFDASQWPTTPAGLAGPVVLRAISE